METQYDRDEFKGVLDRFFTTIQDHSDWDLHYLNQEGVSPMVAIGLPAPTIEHAKSIGVIEGEEDVGDYFVPWGSPVHDELKDHPDALAEVEELDTELPVTNLVLPLANHWLLKPIDWVAHNTSNNAVLEARTRGIDHPLVTDHNALVTGDVRVGERFADGELAQYIVRSLKDEYPFEYDSTEINESGSGPDTSTDRRPIEFCKFKIPMGYDKTDLVEMLDMISERATAYETIESRMYETVEEVLAE